MDENIKIVKSLYKDNSQAISDMHNYTNKNLKVWEKQVISVFPPKAKILDIGCGMGREAFCLNELGFNVTGIDISEDVIDVAKQFAINNSIDVEFLVSNGLDLPFKNSEFDVVIIWTQTFGLFYGEENQQHILAECKRVLKNGGILSFSTHDRKYLESNYKQFLKGSHFYPYSDTDCYYETYEINEIERLSAKAGFHDISCKRGLIYTKDDGPILHCKCKK